MTARISTEGKIQEKLDSKGQVVDKEFVYVSKGFGYVLYKNSQDAAKVKQKNNFLGYGKFK